MLAHGTGVCQWQAVIVSLFLGGLWVQVPVVNSSMSSFVEESLLTNVLEVEKSRLKKILYGLDCMCQTTTYGAQDCYTIVHSVEEDYSGMFAASIDVTSDQFVLESEKS